METQRLRVVILAAQSGDCGAYRELLDAYGRRLYGYFLRATNSHHDAEDLLGEIMLRLVSRLGKYDDRGRFEPWLFRIAANMLRDRIRRAKSRPKPVSLSGDGESGSGLADQILADNDNVDQGLLAEETSRRLQASLMKLDSITREMILLRHFGQMSYKEIADLFQCPLGTALARVHRGLKALRRTMSRENEPD
jgi:RNA polymerase sigma-70 factor (ECF subfamily)